MRKAPGWGDCDVASERRQPGDWRPQFATEMAAPLELRTPEGTCGSGRKKSANGSMATKAREVNGQKNNPRREWMEEE
jgi:hypothetical protein